MAPVVSASQRSSLADPTTRNNKVDSLLFSGTAHVIGQSHLPPKSCLFTLNITIRVLQAGLQHVTILR